MNKHRNLGVLMLVENSPFPQDCRVRREASTLTAAGYTVSVICPSLKSQAAHEVIDRVSVYRYPGPRPGSSALAYVWEYGYSIVAMFVVSLIVLVREGFDIVHAANPPDALVFIAVFYKLLGKKFIFDHHDLAPELYSVKFEGRSDSFLARLLRGLERLSCNLADHVIVTNESYKKIDMERNRVPESRLTVVRNGPNLFSRESKPFPQFRNLGKTIIVFSGSISEKDGVDYLLRSLRHLSHDLQRSDFQCLIVGGGDTESEMRELATRLELDPYVLFTGWVDKEYYSYIATADICVDPDPCNAYNDRCTMIKMLDYMCLAKPIVAFDLPEHRFSAQEAAVYVPGNNELELARALARLMDDPERQRQMGQFGMARIEQVLAWRYSAEHLLKAYRSLYLLPSIPESQPKPKGYIQTQKEDWRKWIAKRSGGYVISRAVHLLMRYGLTAGKAKRRVRGCVDLLARHGCCPTFAVPGRVVAREPQFCRELQNSGVELAVHGYDHVDFRNLTREQTEHQLSRATRSFAAAGINFDGLRCPYLSATEYMEQAINGSFRYTSNKAVWWRNLPARWKEEKSVIYRHLAGFYTAPGPRPTVALPATARHVVELPPMVPDDIQLLDGLKLTSEQLGGTWLSVLHDTYDQGELFVLMFHPETFWRCAAAFETLLKEAATRSPAVWVARLCDVSAWWHRRSNVAVEVSRVGSGTQLRFTAPEEATILVRNMPGIRSHPHWDNRFRVLATRSLELKGGPLPLVGLHPDAPGETAEWLKDAGYFFKIDPSPDRYSLYVESGAFESRSRLSEYLESTSAPLVSVWRWPSGFRSALCVTGDLDALSLTDYFVRLAA